MKSTNSASSLETRFGLLSSVVNSKDGGISLVILLKSVFAVRNIAGAAMVAGYDKEAKLNLVVCCIVC